ncbi:F-box protein FBW2 [Acorus gramineus]|uniref:F-box protein FBW2 n=1 Tax=Acorus gramineus TaxID=55184 RepID=A0AAV9BPF4_ACOGR|nr:F-box protein FBW2 [Acorus gramineus]
MDANGELRCWDELIPDALCLIFRNLLLQDKLTVVPRVCKSWGRAALSPNSWQEIDLAEWSQRCKPEDLDRMVRMLIDRSSGSVRKISVSGLPDDSLFVFIAEHTSSLQTLSLPRSEISDSVVEQVAGRLSNITSLDISYCAKIGAHALEEFGKNCKFLVTLRRVMHPLEVADKVCQDDEAHAVAYYMPKLKHLEMGYLLLTSAGVLEILSSCRDLEFLDIRGCWDVRLDDNFMKERYPRLKLLGPLITNDCYERGLWEDCSDYSDSSGYLAWDYIDDGIAEFFDGESSDGGWDDPQGLEGLEVRFYGGGFNNDGFLGIEWPPSP